MTPLLIKLLLRTCVFGVALTYAVRRDEDVKVQPRTALPLVAAVFALLNLGLYFVLKTALNLATLWVFMLFVPFVVNGFILLVTDRILKPFKIESMTALIRTAGIVTIAHIVLYFAEAAIF